MQIIVQNELTYTTRPLIKQLIDAGHQLSYQMKGVQQKGNNNVAGQPPNPEQSDWLIDGVAAYSLQNVTARQMPLHLAIKHMKR
jgi:hypothetical protein